MAKGQPLPLGSPLQLRGLQRVGAELELGYRSVPSGDITRTRPNRNPASDSEKLMVHALGQL